MKVHKFIGVYQLLGAAFGMYNLIYVHVPNLNVKNMIYYFIILFGLYLIVGIAAYLLVVSENISNTVFRFNIIAQLLQFINFGFNGFEYSFQTGALLGIRIAADSEVLVNFYDSFAKLSFVSEEDYILINFLSLIILFFLAGKRRDFMTMNVG